MDILSSKLNNGFAGEQKTNETVLHEKIEKLKVLLDSYISLHPNDKVLIAGCGKGDEAIIFKNIFLVHTTGIDISLPLNNIIKSQDLELLQADLNAIPFPDNTFSFIYNYHVLEHVESPKNVLKEFRRVLKDDGTIFLGFPNRLRLTPSYLHSNLNKSIFNILNNNMKDYWNKITGRFKNEFGAHAGFSEKEFTIMAKPYFKEIIPIRQQWVKCQYPKFEFISRIVTWLKIANYSYPSNYFILKK
jgi:ubiquinone/menaquinone biosynthesis C-methylase UbiE